MKSLLLIILTLYLISTTRSSHCNSKIPTYGKINEYPLLDGNTHMDLISVHEYGKTYVVHVPNDGGDTAQSFYVSHVWGTPYQMGLAYGSMLRNESFGFINQAWDYFEAQIEQILPDVPEWLQRDIAYLGLELALDLTYEATKGYTNPDIFEEMKGIADGSGLDYNTVVRVHMIAGLTQGKCSLFGAWGEALEPNSNVKLMQLRALDWDMKGPFRDFSSITVYHPDKGVPFVNIGMTGFVGSLTGISSNQLGISEIGVSYPDSSFGEESRIGIPFIFLLREILQYDLTVADATSRMANSRRTCDLLLGVGDGKNSEFRGFAYSYEHLQVFDDMNLRPNNDTWHPKYPGLVYWGMDWECPSFNLVLAQQLKKFYGKLTPEVAIKYITSVEKSGDNHLAYYDLTNSEFYVSFAAPHNVKGNPAAYARQFTKFNAKNLFNEPKPTPTFIQLRTSEST